MKKMWTMGNVALVNADARSGKSDLRSNLALLSQVEEVQPSIYGPLKRQTRGPVNSGQLKLPCPARDGSLFSACGALSNVVQWVDSGELPDLVDAQANANLKSVCLSSLCGFSMTSNLTNWQALV